jgi:glycosyltransferase involved in cell wall biosynthesis
MATRVQKDQWGYFSMIHLLWRWVDCFLTPLPDELEAVGVARSRVRVVEVTIDLTDMYAIEHNPEQAIPPLELTDSYPVVLSVGRLHSDKGHEFAVRAWPLILVRYPHARLVIVGAGEEEPRLQHLTEKLGLGDSVVLAGFRDDLANLFARANIFLRTSLTEGVNLTTAQAMAAGVPVVGFRTPSPRDLVDNGINGFLVPLQDEAALAQAVLELADDLNLSKRFAHNARAAIRHRYDWEGVVATYRSLYEAISRRSSAHPLHDGDQR